MKTREIAELTTEIIERVVPRLEDSDTARRYVPSIRGANRAGEWQVAMESVVGVLADEQIAVTAEDVRDMRRLLDQFALSPSEEMRDRVAGNLADLDRIVVA